MLKYKSDIIIINNDNIMMYNISDVMNDNNILRYNISYEDNIIHKYNNKLINNVWNKSDIKKRYNSY